MTMKEIDKALERIADIEKEIALLIKYAEIKLATGDYHAVADAAMDLRELDVEHKLLRDFLPPGLKEQYK